MIISPNRIAALVKKLDAVYPNPEPPLNFRTPFESLVATILSAQCTDARVNQVTPALFKAAATPAQLLALGEKKLITLIRSTGFFNAKARNILATCRMLVEKYKGEVPADFEALQKLPGVGRKTASVVMSQAFNVPTFPVDRHVFRVAHRLGLATGKTPDQTDLELRAKIPQKSWIAAHLQIIFLGRSYCRPKPKCPECPFLPLCPTGKKLTATLGH